MPRRCWDQLEVNSHTWFNHHGHGSLRNYASNSPANTWMHSSMKAIDDMVASLLKENADAINKDFCTDELNKQPLEMERTGRQGAGPIATIDDLEIQVTRWPYEK